MPSKKSKKSTTPRKLLALPDVLEKEVAQASSWPAVIRAIRRFCNIPDLSTKSGLKECHKKIEDVFAALKYVHFIESQAVAQQFTPAMSLTRQAAVSRQAL